MCFIVEFKKEMILKHENGILYAPPQLGGLIDHKYLPLMVLWFPICEFWNMQGIFKSINSHIMGSSVLLLPLFLLLLLHSCFFPLFLYMPRGELKSIIIIANHILTSTFPIFHPPLLLFFMHLYQFAPHNMIDMAHGGQGCLLLFLFLHLFPLSFPSLFSFLFSVFVLSPVVFWPWFEH